MNTKTKIIATLGPASSSPEVIEALIDAGMTIARLNFSWGTHENMHQIITAVREISEKKGIYVSILQDLSGPRLVMDHGHKINDEAEGVITKKDIDDLVFGLQHSVDYVALSYVASSSDIHDLRKIMLLHGQLTPVIAKVERPEALENIEAICESADGIMIARGDLGIAMPFEQVPFIERKIISICNQKEKFVIVATEMMLSMVTSLTPTRAEVNDVATAVILGANAVMLSEESARGEHPVETVKAMKKIISFADDQKINPVYY